MGTLGKFLPGFVREIIDSDLNYVSYYQTKKVWDSLANIATHDRDSLLILDVGSGKGDFFAFADTQQSYMVGVDRSFVAVKYLSQRVGYSAPVVGNGTLLPFAASSFDIVHCSHVIEHLVPAEAYQLLIELSRVLKRGGYLIIRSPVLYGGGKFGGFFEEFTHVRPYYPSSIVYLMCGDPALQIQTSVPPFPYQFEFVKIYWRRRAIYLPSWMLRTRYGRYLQRILHWAYGYGLTRRLVDGYTLILTKR